MKKDNKGFTLVELLAVIVILAIIMIIAIPAVLDTMQTARRKTFKEYILKVSNATQDKYMKDELTNGTVNQCFVYDITKDLGLPSTGNYKGYTIVTTNGNDEKTVYVTLYDNDFMVYGLKDSQIDKAKLLDYVKDSPQLSKENLAAVASCSTFTYVDNSGATPETKTGTASATPEQSQPRVTFTGEKEGFDGWVGVYTNGTMTGCYNKKGNYDIDGNLLNNGSLETSYCVGKGYESLKASDCEAHKSISCCTASTDPTGDFASQTYHYFYSNNNASSGSKQSCGVTYYKVNGTLKPLGLGVNHGGGLPESGVYED